MAKQEAKHELHHLEIHPAENGGHTVEHHFKMKHSKSGAFITHPDPERYSFGPEEGHKMLAHTANTLGIQGEDAAGEEEGLREEPFVHEEE
ncbi:MAG: hypothetical protein JO041_15610 [Acidobacteria bacterium]|nr:hypothetical protein [Acidobacteriota bacterium]